MVFPFVFLEDLRGGGAASSGLWTPVQGVALELEGCEPRHLGPGLLGAGDSRSVWE